MRAYIQRFTNPRQEGEVNLLYWRKAVEANGINENKS